MHDQNNFPVSVFDMHTLLLTKISWTNIGIRAKLISNYIHVTHWDMITLAYRNFIGGLIKLLRY